MPSTEEQKEYQRVYHRNSYQTGGTAYQYYQNNKEKIAAQQAVYIKSNPEKKSEYNRRYRDKQKLKKLTESVASNN